MMFHLFVSQTEHGWMVQREEVRRGWCYTPVRMGDYHASKRAALADARQRAGRYDRVTVSEPANSRMGEIALWLLQV
jgi:hypothetical protein